MQNRKFLFLLCLAMGVLTTFQARNQKINNAGEALLYVKTVDNIGDKIRFLMSRGQEFIGEKKYKDAQEVAEYILKNLDHNSDEAKDLLAVAKKGEQILAWLQVKPMTVPMSGIRNYIPGESVSTLIKKT